HALGLVHAEIDVLQPPQALGDRAVAGRQAGAAVHHEHHRVGLDDRLLGLARHLDEDALGVARLKAAGIDGDERTGAQAAFPIMAIAGHARQVMDDRVAAAGQAVEQSRLADVRAPDQRDDRLHGPIAYRPPPSVCTSTLPPSATGAARSVAPSVSLRARNAPDSRARTCT